jgi:hypothetical protein
MPATQFKQDLLSYTLAINGEIISKNLNVGKM